MRLGFWRNSVTTRESPSKMKCWYSKDKAKGQVRRATVASPKTGEQRGLIIVKQLIMAPRESLQTATWTKKS
jgi:hypothetical protein